MMIMTIVMTKRKKMTCSQASSFNDEHGQKADGDTEAVREKGDDVHLSEDDDDNGDQDIRIVSIRKRVELG